MAQSTLRGNFIEPQDIFTSLAPNADGNGGTNIGAMATTGDGRMFRYCKVGAVALVPGKLYQASAEDTTNLENLAVTAAAIGATSVTTSTTVTLTANQTAGGFMVISTGTGAGYTYKLKGNTAATAAVTTLNLEDPIIVALDATSKVDITMNPYNSVVVNPTTATSAPIGVPVFAVNVGSYGWLQTHGPCAVLADGTVAVGNPVVASTSTAGAIKNFATNAGTTFTVGVAETGIATTEYGTVFLTID